MSRFLTKQIVTVSFYFVLIVLVTFQNVYSFIHLHIKDHHKCCSTNSIIHFHRGSRLFSQLDINAILPLLRGDKSGNDDNQNDEWIPFLNPKLLFAQSTEKNKNIKNDNNSESDNDSITIEIDPDITLENDIFTTIGIDHYQTNSEVWRNSTMIELSEPYFGIKSISKLDTNRVAIHWNVTFIPDSVVTLASIGRAFPLWRVTFYNVLDRYNIKSSFSWKGLFTFLQHLFFTGEMRLPHAVIEGTTELKFENIDLPGENTLELSKASEYEIEEKVEEIYDNEDRNNNESNNIEQIKASEAKEKREDKIQLVNNEKKKLLPKIWRLVSHTETLQLVQLTKKGLLKNRKLATDLLEFLDTRRPPSYGLNHWNEVIIDNIPFKSVPGMRQFDIDGIEAEEQEKLLTTSSTVLGYVTGSILFLGLGFATVVMDKVFIHRDEQIAMKKTFTNAIHKYVDEDEDVYYY